MQALSRTVPAVTDRPCAVVERVSAWILPKPLIRYAYYAFIFALPFESAIGGLSSVGLILFALTFSQPRIFQKRPPKAFWCFAVYLFVVAVLGLFGIVEAQQDSEFASELISLVFRFGQLLVLFFIAYRLMIFESVAKKSLLIFGLACTLLAGLQLLGLTSANVADERLTTSFGDNPNVVAEVLAIGLLGLLGLAHAQKHTPVWLRLLPWLSSPLLLIVIARTGSRGSQVALVLALIALFVKPESIPQKVKIALGVVAVLSCLGLAIYQIPAVRERWENTYYEGEVAGREVLVPIAWEMFVERPVLGWGPITHFHEMSIRMARFNSGDPHNLYLWLLNQVGLLGAAPFFIGLWICCCSVWRGRGGALGSLPLAWLVFMLAINMKGTYLYDKLFWLVLASALASGSYAVAGSDACRRSGRGCKLIPVRPIP
jgi:O-antigen ligase